MIDFKSYPTPVTANLKLSAGDGVPFEDPSLYRSIIGSLQHVTITKLELGYCVNRVCQFIQAPLDTHWKVVKRILRYLKGTSSCALHLQKSPQLLLTGYSDLDKGLTAIGSRVALDLISTSRTPCTSFSSFGLL